MLASGVTPRPRVLGRGLLLPVVLGAGQSPCSRSFLLHEKSLDHAAELFGAAFRRHGRHDPRLAVLQDNVRQALQTSPYYAIKRAYPETAAALGLRDSFQMYLFADEVNYLVLRRTWPQCLREALARNGQAWSDRFRDVKNIYVTRELSAFCNRDLRRYNRLLLGRHAGDALLALIALTIALHRRDRLLITTWLFFYLCAVSFVFAAAALDEVEVPRHAMAVRPVINALSVLCFGLVVRRLVLHRLRRAEHAL